MLSQYRKSIIKISGFVTKTIGKRRKQSSFSIDLCVFQAVNGPECAMISRSLSSYIYELQYRLQEAIIYQVADDFMDITSTIKTLREVSLLPSSRCQ